MARTVEEAARNITGFDKTLRRMQGLPSDKRILEAQSPAATTAEFIEVTNTLIDGHKRSHPSASVGQISDTYHTFDELYHHRALLFASIINMLPADFSWKAKRHDDGTMFDGMFIVGISTPQGQATYHYDLPYWDTFKCKDIGRAPEFDGHTPEDALNRIFEFSKQFKATLAPT